MGGYTKFMLEVTASRSTFPFTTKENLYGQTRPDQTKKVITESESA